MCADTDHPAAAVSNGLSHDRLEPFPMHTGPDMTTLAPVRSLACAAAIAMAAA